MTSQDGGGYQTPAAFRRALTDKLRALAATGVPWPLPDLQRQFAFDRLLTRLYLMDDRWVIKGSTALLARRIAVRHTIDVDIHRAVNGDQAERDLRTALLLEGGDWFTFEAGLGRVMAAGTGGTRVPINARIGTTTWSRFHVDLVGEGVAMTGEPDTVPALTTIVLPGLHQPAYRVYPLHDHIADKICAILERQGPAQRPSTRYKDLVDLVALVIRATPTAAYQERALASEARRRGLALPSSFHVPESAGWEIGYAAEARRAVLPGARTLPEALASVRPFVDPLLRSAASGSWDPGGRAWN